MFSGSFALMKLLEGLVVVAMLTGGQLMFKRAANLIGSGKSVSDFIWALATSWTFWIALAIYGLATLLWMHMLTKYELSTSHGILALSYIAVPLIGMIWLGEPFRISVLIALGFIIVGVGILITTN